MAPTGALAAVLEVVNLAEALLQEVAIIALVVVVLVVAVAIEVLEVALEVQVAVQEALVVALQDLQAEDLVQEVVVDEDNKPVKFNILFLNTT